MPSFPDLSENDGESFGSISENESLTGQLLQKMDVELLRKELLRKEIESEETIQKLEDDNSLLESQVREFEVRHNFLETTQKKKELRIKELESYVEDMRISEQNNIVETERREYETKLQLLALDKESKDYKKALENERLENISMKTELGDSEIVIRELHTHVETIAKSEKTTGVSMGGVRAMLTSQQLKYEKQISILNKIIDKLKTKVTMETTFTDPVFIHNCIEKQNFFFEGLFLPSSVDLHENGCQSTPENSMAVSCQTINEENSTRKSTCDLNANSLVIMPDQKKFVDQTTQKDGVDFTQVSIQTEPTTRLDFQSSMKFPHPPKNFDIQRPQTETAPFDSDELNSNSDVETFDASFLSSRRHDNSKFRNFRTPAPDSSGNSRPRSASISRYNTGSPRTDFNPLNSFITPIPIPPEKKANSRPVYSTRLPDNYRRPFSATGHPFLANSIGYGRMLHDDSNSDDSPLFSRVCRKHTRPKTNDAPSHFSDMRYPSVARVRNPASVRQNPSTLLESVSSGRRQRSRFQDLQKKTPAQREMEDFIDKLYDGN